MGINFADEKVNVKSIPQFGSTRKILNPVEEEIKKSCLKIPKPEYERLSVENYMTKEEYKAFSSLSPSQQKRAFEVFKQSPEYKRFKKKLDAQSELLSKNVTDSVTFFDEKNKKNEQPSTDNQNYSYRINEQETTYSAMENTKKAGEQTAKKAAENGAKTAAQTGAAAGSGGASEIAKEATEAVKKNADTLKDASSQPESDPTDYQTEHSSDIAISKSGMGTIQKITAVIMAFAAALISQLGVILLPLLIVLAVVIVIVSLLVALISSIAGAVKDASSAQVIAGLYRQLLSDNTISYTQDVKDAAVNEQIEDYVNYLLAIMEVESHGIGTDVMQSSESAGLPPNSFKTPQESIAQGAKYFASCVMKASEKECDINTAIQAYNFGTGFIDYVAENGKVYTLDLAIAFAEEKSGGKQVAYKNQIAINYNGGWRYAYGNMFYAQLVNQFIYNYDNATVQKIVDEVMKYSGWDYISGGSSPDDGGFDCSGLVQYVYGKAGINLPRLEKDQYEACEEIEEENIQPGDLIFYKNETSNGEIGHVAIYLGNGKVFEAGDPIGIYSATDEWHTSNQLHIGRVKGIEDADSASDD
uniref:bifunctional lytic transglycosylase/C40 family peptidase n=1 Tax=Lachnospira sp. TaxID=2049031 RepID=UPI003FEFAA5C